MEQTPRPLNNPIPLQAKSRLLDLDGDFDEIQVISSDELNDETYHRHPKTLHMSGESLGMGDFSRSRNTFGHPPSGFTIHIGYNANNPSNDQSITTTPTEQSPATHLQSPARVHTTPSRTRSLPLPSCPAVGRRPSKPVRRVNTSPGLASKSGTANAPGSIASTTMTVSEIHHYGGEEEQVEPTHFCGVIPYYLTLGPRCTKILGPRLARHLLPYFYPTILTIMFLIFCILSVITLLTLLITWRQNKVGKDVLIAFLPLGTLFGFSLWGIWGFRVPIEELAEVNKEPIYGHETLTYLGTSRVIVDNTLEEKRKYRQTKIDDIEAQMFAVLADIERAKNSRQSSIVILAEQRAKPDDARRGVAQDNIDQHHGVGASTAWSWTSPSPPPSSPSGSSTRPMSPIQAALETLTGNKTIHPTQESTQEQTQQQSTPRPTPQGPHAVQLQRQLTKKKEKRKSDDVRRILKMEWAKKEFGGQIVDISGPIR